MENSEVLVTSPLGVLAVLVFVAAFFFMLQQATKAKLFDYLPPLLFIYATPVFLNNLGVIPSSSPVYSGLSAIALPIFIVLMLIKVNVPAVVRVMGKGVLVMLMGTAGVMVGGVVAYFVVHGSLSDDAWGAMAPLRVAGLAAPRIWLPRPRCWVPRKNNSVSRCWRTTSSMSFGCRCC